MTKRTGYLPSELAVITYIPLEDGMFCYLAVLMDLFSRRIAGWHLADNMTKSLVLVERPTRPLRIAR